MESNENQFFQDSNSTLLNNGGMKDFYHPNGYSEQELNHTIAICVVNFFLCLTALFANFAVIIAIWKSSFLLSPAKILLSSLAVSDLAVGLIAHPLFIAYLLAQIYGANISRTLWVAFNILSTFLSSASLLTVTAIGVDRLLAVELHLRYEAVVTHTRVRWLIFFIWILCGACSTIGVKSLNLYYQFAAPILVTLLVGNFAVYLRLYLIVRRHKSQIQQQQQQQQQEAHSGNVFSMKRFKRTAVNTFLVYVLLICCYTPQCFVAVTLFQSDWQVSHSVEITTGTVVLLNSSLNPALYCWRVREIRSALKQYFCC